MVMHTKGEHLRIRVKDIITGEEGWMKAEVFFEAIAEIILNEKKPD